VIKSALFSRKIAFSAVFFAFSAVFSAISAEISRFLWLETAEMSEFWPKSERLAVAELFYIRKSSILDRKMGGKWGKMDGKMRFYI
jgi:hypothetical protein